MSQWVTANTHSEMPGSCHLRSIRSARLATPRTRPLTSLRPTRNAKIAYQDAEIIVYTDGTWRGVVPGATWNVTPKTQAWANDAGPVNLVTAWGHYKYSPIISPSGHEYDVWALAAGS